MRLLQGVPEGRGSGLRILRGDLIEGQGMKNRLLVAGALLLTFLGAFLTTDLLFRILLGPYVK